MFIDTDFPCTSASVDCLFCANFLVGSMIFSVAGVFFWFILFGDGAMFSDVEEPSSLDDVICSGVAGCLVARSSLLVVFFSVARLRTRAGVLCDLPPTPLPVGLFF